MKTPQSESIEPFIHRKILVMKSTATIQTAARAMCERLVGSAVVADEDGHLVGFVTDRDIACRAMAYGVSSEDPLSEIMSIDIQTIDENAKVRDVIQIMIDGGIRRVPVVHEGQGGKRKCLGLISFDDLVASGTASLEDLQAIITAQIRRKAHGIFNQDRSDDRKEQTYNRFLAHMEKVLELNRDLTESFTLHILKIIVRRLPANGAAHFICQLPSLMQEDLFSLRAGPDRTITAQVFLDEARLASHSKSEKSGALALVRLRIGLEGYFGKEMINHVMIQLPEEIRLVFAHQPSTKPGLEVMFSKSDAADLLDAR